MTKVDITKKNILEALEKSLGIVTTACRMVGLSRQQFYNYCDADEDFLNAVKSIEGIALDFAESQLHKRIKDGSDAAIIFYLKTKGKKRGYIERIEQTGADGEKLPSPTIIIHESDRNPGKAS